MNASSTAILGYAIWVAAAMLGVAVVLTFLRLARGPSLPDRIVAFDLLGVLLVGVIAVYSIATGESLLIDVAIVLAIVAFLGTVAFARYLERSGHVE